MGKNEKKTALNSDCIEQRGQVNLDLGGIGSGGREFWPPSWADAFPTLLCHRQGP